MIAQEWLLKIGEAYKALGAERVELCHRIKDVEKAEMELRLKETDLYEANLVKGSNKEARDANLFCSCKKEHFVLQEAKFQKYDQQCRYDLAEQAVAALKLQAKIITVDSMAAEELIAIAEGLSEEVGA
jgi:hypothetical protein